MESSLTLAPFQHVRFSLRYPSDCKSDPTEDEHIDLNAKTWELLTRVNHGVNMSIIPTHKSYRPNLVDAWSIAPEMGDCNDYAVTKRHELLENGLPSRDLRLSVVIAERRLSPSKEAFPETSHLPPTAKRTSRPTRSD